MGGDSRFANIRGVLSSINDLYLFDIFNINEKKTNYWGAPDHLLLKKAHEHFTKIQINNKSFVAIILTSSNHSPYFVPENIRPLLKIKPEYKNWTKAQWEKHGFSSYEVFSTTRYSDYAIGKFMQIARESNYFENTIFAFIGDHGKSNYVGDYAEPRLKNTALHLNCRHVPFVIVAPSLIEPKKINYPVAQMDIFPTIMGILGMSYEQTTMGRDVLNPDYDPSVFTFRPSVIPEIGFMDEKYYFLSRVDGSSNKLYDLSGKITEISKNEKQKVNLYKEKVNALYALSNYLIPNNKPVTKSTEK